MLTVDEYSLNYITGTINGINSKVFLRVDGVDIRRGEIDAGGNTFRIYAKDAVLSKNQTVEIVGESNDGQSITANVEVI